MSEKSGMRTAQPTAMRLQGEVVVEAFLPRECSAWLTGPLLATDPAGNRRFTLSLRATGDSERDARRTLLESALRLYDEIGSTIDALRDEIA